MRRLFLLLILLALTACATVSGKTDSPQVTAGKSLVAIQKVIVTTREAIGVPCQQGVIPQSDCQAMHSLYLQSKPAFDAAADAEIIALRTGSEETNATAKRQDLERLEIELLTLALKYGIEGGK